MTNVKNLILGFESGEDLNTGDIVYLNASSKLVKCTSAEVTDAVGIVYSGAESGKTASVIAQGVIENAHLLIENTSGSSGYDSPIANGDLLIISGKASGTYTTGQALSAVGGTAQTTAVPGMVVGKALCVKAGSSSVDTYTTGRVMVNFLN